MSHYNGTFMNMMLPRLGDNVLNLKEHRTNHYLASREGVVVS